jgi:hypothetical protein
VSELPLKVEEARTRNEGPIWATTNLMFAALLFVESIIDLFRVFFLNIAYDDVSGLNIV